MAIARSRCVLPRLPFRVWVAVAALAAVVLSGCSSGDGGAPEGRGATEAARAAGVTQPDPAAHADRHGAAGGGGPVDGWVLHWADEFDSGVVGDRWNVRDGQANANEASFLLADNVRQADGLLTITARKEQAGGREHTSGYLDTIGRTHLQVPMRVEIRAKVPTAAGRSDGLWPAFWLRSNESGGEIDVAEWYGSLHPERPHTHRAVTHSVHEDTHGRGQRSSATWLLPEGAGPPDGFHTYAVEVLDDRVVFSVDGTTTHVLTVEQAPWLRPQLDDTWNIRLNLQVGREGSWAGAPTAATRWPADFVVDHVRVYRP